MQKILAEKKFKNGKTLILILGGISDYAGDALINPTNPQLSLNNGIGKKILGLEKQEAGNDVIHNMPSKLEAACIKWVRKHGAVTSEKPGYTMTLDLPFQAIIHTVIPAYSGQQNEDFVLWKTIQKALDLADLLSMHSAGIPDIPNWTAAAAGYFIVRGCCDYLLTRESGLSSIHLLLDDENSAKVYRQYLEDFQN